MGNGPQARNAESQRVRVGDQDKEKGKVEHRESISLAFDCDKVGKPTERTVQVPAVKLEWDSLQKPERYGIMGTVKENPRQRVRPECSVKTYISLRSQLEGYLDKRYG